MHTPREIYEHYKIPPLLQLHQLRVAAVGKMLCDKFSEGVRAETVILTGLFHDMGNILKIDLSEDGPLLSLIEPGKLEYWRDVKEDFARMYGTNEHVAGMAIGHEIGLSGDVLNIIDNMSLSKTVWILQEGSLEMNISKYADLRVGPRGILSLQGRLAEWRERYKGKEYDAGKSYDKELISQAEKACAEIEKYVCAATHIHPSDITDESIALLIEKLKDYPVTAS
ncbi:hypothetical protein A2755_03120 [Candidatus Wolfebacteria bacterium RIFCSPHIGHO2_01_FULL_48_22]|uniref:HD domain-containing protein n=1 Tax=Candidatus Wolfebacteria bacterium RIFCSPHIGHO2_01_FULL_48_22 TaxID=1802555 RepID=A0A1F8DT33_9BACT|nr:MAG: hypothetical protein A2755_03120 [Candidatus Wolfebacteria bacterium RIFCSPHIGHO2_01_FULL_48_22]